MRATEFINETKKTETVNKNYNKASVGSYSYPSAETVPYTKYRLGIAVAGAPDCEHEFNAEGPSAGLMLSVHYTPAEEEMMNIARKRVGISAKKLTSKNSTELDTTGTVSPVANWMKK
jgi:hypothetical protein